MAWKKVKIGEFLNRVKKKEDIKDNKIYKRVTIKSKNKGICVRDIVYGNEIGTKKQFKISKGQFLLSKIDARFGAFGIVPDELDEAIITGNFWTYDVDYKLVNIELFNLLVSSKNFIDICNKASSGTTHRKYLNEEKFLNFEIKLPDIQIQNQIVERYKKIEKKINILNQEITNQEELLKKLRQAILQEAIEGKLTKEWREKNPNVENANILFEKIQKEKENLIKQKKIKKQKPLPPITNEEIPFEIPDTWKWCRFVDITSVITCGIASTPKYYESGKIFLSAKNIKPYKFLPEEHKYIDNETYNKIISNAKPEKNDILLTRVGAGIGESAIIDKDIDFAYYVSLTLIKPIHKYINSKFIVHFLNSNEGIKNAVTYSTGKGSSQGNLNVNNVRKFLLPIPPLEEQKEIVKKIDNLFQMCDKLETEIKKSKQNSEMLIKALLKEVFEDED